MAIRNLKAMQTANNGTRSLLDSILVPEVKKALADWLAYNGNQEPLLIGGLAFSYYCKPRYTQDIDLLFLNAAAIPMSVPGFKKNRAHSFEHQQTGVEIEVLDPVYLGLPGPLVKKVYETSKDVGNIRIPSVDGMIALKAMRMSLQDKADIDQLVKLTKFDTSTWTPAMPADKAANLISLLGELE